MAFLSTISGDDAEALSDVLASSELTVETQVSAGKLGRPDLVIFLDRAPFLLFENKVAHSVGEDFDREGKARNQLQRYARWMHEKRCHVGATQTLIFLTHITTPPHDFAARAVEECPYFNVKRRVQSWGDVSRLLLNVTKPEGERSISYQLSKCFYQFLKEWDMDNEYPDSKDLAAVELFLHHGVKCHNLVTEMWKAVSGIANSSNQSRELIQPELDYGRYTGSRYINRPQRLKNSFTFIMTGIWFHGLSDVYETEDLREYEAHGPFVFLTFSNDDFDVFDDVKGKPGENWLRPGSDFLVLKSLHDFTGSPDERAGSILNWVTTEGSKLRAFLLKEGLTT